MSAVVADLPVHLAEPQERLAAIRAEMSELKEVRAASAAEALITLGRFTPFPLASLTVRLAYRLPQRELVTVTTKVPGPHQPLYGVGRKLVEIIPYVPIATNLRTGVSIFSYCGQLTLSPGCSAPASRSPSAAAISPSPGRSSCPRCERDYACTLTATTPTSNAYEIERAVIDAERVPR